jgi:hypothetical protein
VLSCTFSPDGSCIAAVSRGNGCDAFVWRWEGQAVAAEAIAGVGPDAWPIPVQVWIPFQMWIYLHLHI